MIVVVGDCVVVIVVASVVAAIVVVGGCVEIEDKVGDNDNDGFDFEGFVVPTASTGGTAKEKKE